MFDLQSLWTILEPWCCQPTQYTQVFPNCLLPRMHGDMTVWLPLVTEPKDGTKLNKKHIGKSLFLILAKVLECLNSLGRTIAVSPKELFNAQIIHKRVGLLFKLRAGIFDQFGKWSDLIKKYFGSILSVEVMIQFDYKISTRDI